MKILNFKLKTAILFLVFIMIAGVFIWQGKSYASAFYFFKIGNSIFGGSNNIATATNSALSNPKNNKPGAKSKKTRDLPKEIPFGLSNPYDQKDLKAKAALPSALKDLGLSDNGNGEAGFVVDEIARKNTEATCNDTACQEYDFSSAKNLIDLVVGQGKVNLWIVINTSSYHKFTDGKVREDGKTYLSDGPVSRQAYKDYLEKMINFVNSYGKQVSGSSNWHVAMWNIDNEVPVEYKNTFDKNIETATMAYTNLAMDTAEILRRLSPQSKIVLAGAGEGAGTEAGAGISQADFYEKVFSKLKQAGLNYSPFDYWDAHWFGKSGNYKESKKGYGAKSFVKFLQDNGYSDKGFVIRAGGTYSGQDTQERKQLMNDYQSEGDQAEFLVKRFVYNIANGVKKIAWSTVYERDKYQGEKHVHFQYISLIYDGYPDGVSKNQKCVEGWLPCPDPGRGVKKLSYYAFKHLVEKLKGSDWNNVQTIQESNDVYVYKFKKENKNVWVVWNDSKTSNQIIISDINSAQVSITEAVPRYESGKGVISYKTAFNTETKTVNGGKIEITLKDKTVFVEEK